MRRVLALLCAASLLAAACSRGGELGGTETSVRRASAPADGATTTEPPAPAYGGTVVIGGDQEPLTLNPFADGGDVSTVATIGQTYLAGVYDVDGSTLQLVPELVTELPSVGNGGVVLNDDGTMTVRWVIRDDAVWSDGVPVTAADLAFTWNLMRDPDISRDQWTELDVVAVNSSAKTFSMTFAAPTVEYETLFRYIVPRHAVEGTDFLTDWNTQMWPSAGPFVFSEWKPGEYIKLTRNDHYWKTDSAGNELPYLDAVEFRFIQDGGDLLFQFTQRQLDVIQPIYDAETIKSLERLESDGVDLQLEAGPIWEHLNFQFGPNNRNPESLNRFRSFRQAVAYAIDPERIAALVGWAPIFSFLDLHAKDGAPWAQYSFDPRRAKELLADACAAAERDCDADPPVAILSTTNDAEEERPRIADYLASALGNIGIDVELQLEDSQVFFGDTLNDGTWDIGWFAWAWNPGASRALETLERFDPDSSPPDGKNLYRWGTPDSTVADDDAVARFRGVMAVARNSFDSAQVMSLSRAAEQILADNAVVIPVGARQVAAAVWADTIVGFDLNPSQAGSTWNIEYWYRRER